MKNKIYAITVAVLAVFLTTPVKAELANSQTGVAMGGLGVINTTGSMHGPFLSTRVKVAEQKELVFDLSLECGLYTKTNVKSKGGSKDTSVATASVKVNILVIDDAGNVSFAYPGGEGVGVVYCQRTQELSAVFQGLLTDPDGNVCLVADPETGVITIDEDCLQPEEVELILDTMNANAFNFVSPNLDQGVYTIEVWAEIDTDTSTQEGSATALATLGRGSLVVDEVRFIKGSDGMIQ